jgi:hypothetical protein
MSNDTTETDGRLSFEVVASVAAKTGREPSEMEPLYNVVDTDALDGLFEGANGTVRFPYEGYRVTVSADGSVTVEDF